MKSDRPHPKKGNSTIKNKRGKFHGNLKEFVYVERINPAPPGMIKGWEEMDLYNLLDFIEDRYKIGIHAGDGMEMTLGLAGIEMRDFGVSGDINDWNTGFPIYYSSNSFDRRYSANPREIEGCFIGMAINLAFDYINKDYPAETWHNKYWKKDSAIILNECGTWVGEHFQKDDC